METFVILWTENHRDKEHGVSKVCYTYEEAEFEVMKLEDADKEAMAKRGYPNATKNFYSIQGPFLVT